MPRKINTHQKHDLYAPSLNMAFESMRLNTMEHTDELTNSAAKHDSLSAPGPSPLTQSFSKESSHSCMHVMLNEKWFM